MERQEIQDRINLLLKEQEQVKTVLGSYEGAIQDCKYWLQKLDTPNTEPESPKEE